jgi:hypothetical protein
MYILDLGRSDGKEEGLNDRPMFTDTASSAHSFANSEHWHDTHSFFYQYAQPALPGMPGKPA